MISACWCTLWATLIPYFYWEALHFWRVIMGAEPPSLRDYTTAGSGLWLILTVWVLTSWVGAAIAWRWEAVGGVLLTLVGLLPLSLLVVLRAATESVGQLTLLITGLPPVAAGLLLERLIDSVLVMGLPPLLAGIVLLASWWRSRRLTPAHNSE